MSLYKRYETSNELSIKGAPVKFEANEDGTVPTFFIARSHSSNQLFAKAVKEHYQGGTENMSDEELKAANLAVFLDSNLMGWRNVQGRDGLPLEFNRGNAETLLTDLPEILNRLHFASQSVATYLKVNEEKAVKN